MSQNIEEVSHVQIINSKYQGLFLLAASLFICSKLINSLIYLAINCTSEPFLVRNNDMGMFNWTGIDGEDPRPYATAIRLDMLF